MKYWHKIPLFGRAPGSDRFGRGSVFFECYKHPEIEVTTLDCQQCPFGDYYKDWQGNGWLMCWHKWQQEIQHLKELEQKERQEKMDFEQMLRENQAENEELREKWRREEEEQEPRLRRLREQVEKEVREGMKLSLWPEKKDQIDWDRVHGGGEAESEEESSDEDDEDSEG